MRLNTMKRTVMATALAVATAVAGIAGQAQAFTFDQNDLVLAIYGNNTEALYNLGTNASLTTAGPTTDINLGTAGLSAAEVGGNPIKWTVFGFDLGGTGGGQIQAATAFTPAQITGPVDFTSQLNPTVNMTASSFAGDTVAKASPGSFSFNLDTAGASKMEGAWPVAMKGSLDQILNLMNGDVASGAFSQIGRVQFTSDGHLLIGNPGPAVAAVPLPAGVVLFGTGLVALVGLARRKFNQMTA